MRTTIHLNAKEAAKCLFQFASEKAGLPLGTYSGMVTATLKDSGHIDEILVEIADEKKDEPQ